MDNSKNSKIENVSFRTVDPGVFVWKSGMNSIDYGNPELYLTPGSQSDISDKYLDEINKEVKIENKDIADIRVIYDWKQNYFKTYAAGGAFIGQITVNQIMEKEL